MLPTVPGRLAAQRLVAPLFDTAAQVVRHLGCVQSQLPDMAWWAVGRRTTGLTLADLQASFDAGELLRTHILRPTWHLVDPDDIAWMLHLTAPRIRRLIVPHVGGPHPERVLDRAAEVIMEALADGGPRTRGELGQAMADAGLPVSGQPMADLVMHAEISALIVNGPMRAKQHTYRLLAARPVTEPRDELLARIARRYARGHGPVRDKDLAWWTGLTLTDSRRAIALGELRPLDVDGRAYWMLDDPVEVEIPAATLLPNFDEYISYAREAADYAQLGTSVDTAMRRAGLLLVEGRLAGTWTRTVSATVVDITVSPGRPLTARARQAVEQEAQAYAAFVGRDPALVVTR